MREIKFRFWLSSGSRWLDDVRIDKDGSIYPTTPSGEYDWNIDCLKVTSMQFSGLKDKNGKDIYEGDIVVIEDNTGASCFYEIKWRQDVYAIVGEGCGEWLNMEEFEGCEIIGNIHENPRLRY